MVQKLMVEKFGVENFMVEKTGVKRCGVEAWGKKVQGWDVLQPLKSPDEALPWKEKQCRASKNSDEYKENERRCKKKSDKPRCTMLGVSYHNQHEKRNILKYCYRLIFIEIPKGMLTN